jgi:hypothetical protein
MRRGDIVIIVRAAHGEERLMYGRWVEEMDAMVGKEGSVVDIEPPDSRVRVQIGVSRYTYPPQCVALANPMLPGHGPNNTHIAQELPR